MTVYFDHNATTPLRTEVREAMLPFLGGRWANPSSLHGPGQEARAVVDAARRAVERLVGGAGDVVFTGSGTEAVFTAVTGAAGLRSAEPGHAVVSALEHRSGRDAAAALERAGWSVTRVAPDRDSGRLSPEAVAGALRPGTRLVSVIHADSETGIVQPVEEIRRACSGPDLLFHTDAVQTAGRLDLDAGRGGFDLVSLSAHKLGGPPGVGAVWRRRGVALDPLIPGTQEGGIRGGTHNLAGIAGFAAAAHLALDRGGEDVRRVAALRERLERSLGEAVPAAAITGAGSPRLPNTTHVTFGENPPPDLVMALDLEGFAVSAGSACASGSAEPSPVLLAMGMSEARARGALRVSLGPDNTEDEVDRFVAALAKLAAGARGASR